jgi:hypothetical protein
VEQNGLRFFEVCAQLIPLIFIVLLLELRMFDRYLGVNLQPTDYPDPEVTIVRILTVLGIVMLLFLGEFRTLTVLIREEASIWDFRIVKTALIFGGYCSILPLARTLHLIAIAKLEVKQARLAQVIIMSVFIGALAVASITAMNAD